MAAQVLERMRHAWHWLVQAVLEPRHSWFPVPAQRRKRSWSRRRHSCSAAQPRPHSRLQCGTAARRRLCRLQHTAAAAGAAAGIWRSYSPNIVIFQTLSRFRQTHYSKVAQSLNHFSNSWRNVRVDCCAHTCHVVAPVLMRVGLSSHCKPFTPASRFCAVRSSEHQLCCTFCPWRRDCMQASAPLVQPHRAHLSKRRSVERTFGSIRGSSMLVHGLSLSKSAL